MLFSHYKKKVKDIISIGIFVDMFVSILVINIKKF